MSSDLRSGLVLMECWREVVRATGEVAMAVAMAVEKEEAEEEVEVEGWDDDED